MINGSDPGSTRVLGYTNAAGVAQFEIVGTPANADPVYFEANFVDAGEGYSYGYSMILPIRFTSP